MNELDPAPAPQRHDLEDLLATATAALTMATAERHRIESEIRSATSTEVLAVLHDAWRHMIELQCEADQRQRDVLQWIAAAN